MKKKIQEKKDESIAAQYSLPEVVVSAPYLTKYNDPKKPTGFPQYEAKSDDIAEFYKSWVSSPEYERRMKDTGYYETPMYNSSRQSSITLPKGRSTIYLSPNEFLEDVRRERMGLLESTQDPGFIEYDPKYASEYRWSGINLNPKDITTPERKQSVLAHEIAHAIDTTTPYESELISGTMFPTDAFNKQFYSQYSETHPVTGEPILSSEGWKKREKAAYVKNDPQEFKSDLNALRYLMFDKGIYDIRKGKQFTKKDLEKAKEKLKGNESLQRSLDAAGESGFIKLMNIIAKGDEEVAPIAMNGASMPGAVGFTYARTAGAAPSNGPYAKKTKASAQSGIMIPMLLARNVLNYFYPSEEDVSTVEVAPAPVEYKKGLTDELLKRQAYKESTFNPAAVSPAGYKGLTQIGEEVLADYSKKKGGKKLDPFNPKDAVELQKFAMDDLYNASFINKPNQPDSVRIAKTLAAYNWGRGNLFNYLNEQKQKGVDIYGSYDWLNDLPKETSDYVNKILLQEDQSFNKNYKRDSTNPKYKDVTSLYDKKKFGGKVTTAQNGQEMRFYQNGLDWKPKSMQDGGIQRISTSDPRYPELYKNRQVGAFYDGAYSLPDLPEVVVTGKDERLKEAMYERSNKFGMNALGLMSAPQVVMMEALTGKQQTPSEAFGFQNTGGWLDSPISFGKNVSNLAMDAILDPVNLLGVGLAGDITRTTLKGVGKRTVPNIRPVGNIRSSIDDIRRGSDLRGTGFEENPFYHKQLFEDRKKSVIERLNTDKGRQRLQDFIDDNYKNNPKSFGTENQNLLQWFKSGFKDYTKITPDKVVDDLKKMEFVPSSYAGFNKDNAFLWFHKGINNPSVMNIGEAITPYDALHTFEHELAHFFQRNRPSTVDNILSKLKLKEIEDPIKLNVFRSEAPLTETGYSTTKLSPHYTTLESPKNYFTSGSRGQEKMPFAAELRENLLQRGIIKDYYDDITPDLLRKHKDIYDKTGGAKRIQRLYQIMEDSPENLDILSQALNKMPQVALPIAGGAAATISALQNQQPVLKQKNGGITKDNLGYWNPDNWGKPVEIDSNIITMEGVYEPLLGISDTGDTKLMKPGKNYKFKGKKVTEFPVAELGINQLDAQPMKKLNQLLNFTNNPDKDNWLDKYN